MMSRSPADHGMRLISATPFDDVPRTYNRFADGDLEVYEYTGWPDESMSWKETAYIGNWSTLGKTIASGPKALELLSTLSVNSYERFEVGQAKHIVMCLDSGHVTGEGIALRLNDDEFMVTSTPASRWVEVMASTRFATLNVKTRGCFFREMISLCTVDVAYAKPGTEVSVLWGTPPSSRSGFEQSSLRRHIRRIDGAATFPN